MIGMIEHNENKLYHCIHFRNCVILDKVPEEAVVEQAAL